MREAAARRQHVKERNAFFSLAESAIRDLGMSRCEFDSYWVESHGLAEVTRVRVARSSDRSYVAWASTSIRWPSRSENMAP
ncbi:MAG: hypothetical protein K0R58_93 [Ramlibacter sp.]|jgi:hypothetical protein|nr:hypothetical protein [Ramlibacter sp.]